MPFVTHAVLTLLPAYGTLLGKCGIMHRDISDSNILINLSTRRGLLIDLDLAVDVKGRIERHPHQMFNEFPGLDISGTCLPAWLHSYI